MGLEKSNSTLRDDPNTQILQQILNSQMKIEQSMTSMQMNIQDIQANMASQNQSIKSMEHEINIVKSRVSDLETRPSQTSHSSIHSPQENNVVSQLIEQVNRVERKQRERNLRLVGFEEKFKEDCVDIIGYIINEELNINAYIETAHRTGRRSHYPRHIIFCVSSLSDKIEILRSQRHSLNTKGYFFTDDLTSKDYNLKRQYKPQIDAARREGHRWIFKNGTLFVNGLAKPLEPRNRAGVPDSHRTLVQQHSHIHRQLMQET